MRKAITAILFGLQVIFNSIYAQPTYPVTVAPVLTPPYSLKLGDYCSFGSQQLMVNITVNDLDISNMPVKLRIKLETVGVTIENPVTFNTVPIYLDGGSTAVLFGKDLADNFNIQNLVFKGYSKEAYRRTGQLPEGYYKFTVEVLHFLNNRPVSNQGTATAWIALGKPPELKLPANGEKMGQYNGMPLTFSWLASNVGSPVSTGSIQYKFEMWEMRIDGIAPNTVAASVPVFHEHTTFNTTYSLYPSMLMMGPGMKYAWRVTASDVGGSVPFEQDGKSEIRTFEYKAACDTISGLTARQQGQNGLFSWGAEENHTSFNVEMRDPLTGWASLTEAYDNKASFYGLEYGSTYEMRVQAVCDGDGSGSASDYSGWKSLTIKRPAPLIDTATCPNCGCSDDIPEAELTNFILRYRLQPGDTITNKTGTTRYIIVTAEPQGNGAYKGIFLFWAEIWGLQIYCEYWDLQVNTDNVIVNMDFESVYDPQFLVNIDAAAAYLDSLAGAANTLVTDTRIKDTLKVQRPLASVYINADGALMAVTVDENGKITEELVHSNASELEQVLVQGADGKEYVVDKNGDIMGAGEYKKTGGTPGNIDKYNKEKEANALSETVEVNFWAAGDQSYGFDAYNEEKTALLQSYPTLKNGYRPAYKSVASYGTDIVLPMGTGANITFKDEMGIPAIQTGDKLTIRGGADGSEVALYAYQAVDSTTEKIAGKLGIRSYDQQAATLYMVPVNGARLPGAKELEEVLNKVYGQAVTKWTVNALDRLDVAFENGNMVHGGSKAVSVYNPDQKSVIKKFEEENGSLEKGAFYLFFVEGVQDKGRNIAGYMPLQRQAGFIYDYPSLATVAHELGHGAFNLCHPFNGDEFIASEGSTKNLMDYTGGTELWKHQWAHIQDPENIVLAFMQDEEEGEIVSEEPLCEVSRFINTIKCAKNKNLDRVTLHHSWNSYSVKIGKLAEKIYKYSDASKIEGLAQDIKEAYLNVYIDDGVMSSGSDFYFGYHNFDLQIGNYEIKPAEGLNPRRLIFSAGKNPIIFSFPISTDDKVQKEAINWLEKECGLKTNGSTFEEIHFDVKTGNINDLFSLSLCQLEQINLDDRKKLIKEAINNVEGLLGIDKDSYQYLFANLIYSTPETQVNDMLDYLIGMGGDIELLFLDLSETAQEVLIEALCNIALKSWQTTKYIGKVQSYFLGVNILKIDEFNDRIITGTCGIFKTEPGIYQFGIMAWLSSDGRRPDEVPDADWYTPVSAFDPIECHFLGEDHTVENSEILPAIVVKIFAVNKHIKKIDDLLNVPKMVLLPEISSQLFTGVARIGKTSCTQLKSFFSTIPKGLGRLLDKFGAMGYKLKVIGTEFALYTNLNIEVARFSSTGNLITKVYPSSKLGTSVLSWEDEIAYTTTLDTKQTGLVEYAVDANGVYFWRELNALRESTVEIGKAAVTYEDYLYYANEAYKVYSKELTTAVQEIENIAGDLGQVTGRAKRAESAANRLQRAVENGWVTEINSTDKALDNIWDALGTRVVLKNGDAASVDAFVNNLCDAIEKGEIEVVSVNSLTGKEGIPYLTKSHLTQIEDATSLVGKRIRALPKEYESGYTTATIYIKYGNNVRGELQLIGQETLEIANAEHWVYDAFLGKPYAEYLEAFTNAEIKDVATKLIERIRKPAVALTESQKVTYNSYLNSVYQNARNIESGNSLSTVALPSGIPQELSAESLLRTDQLIGGLKNGTVNKLEAINFLNGN